MQGANVSLQQIHLVLKDAFRSLFLRGRRNTRIWPPWHKALKIFRKVPSTSPSLTQDGSTAQLHLILTQVGRIVVIVVKYRPGHDIIHCNCNENVVPGLNLL